MKTPVILATLLMAALAQASPSAPQTTQNPTATVYTHAPPPLCTTTLQVLPDFLHCETTIYQATTTAAVDCAGCAALETHTKYPYIPFVKRKMPCHGIETSTVGVKTVAVCATSKAKAEATRALMTF